MLETDEMVAAEHDTKLASWLALVGVTLSAEGTLVCERAIPTAGTEAIAITPAAAHFTNRFMIMIGNSFCPNAGDRRRPAEPQSITAPRDIARSCCDISDHDTVST